MTKVAVGRIIAGLLFLLLLVGALFCLQRIGEDISAGRYFAQSGEFRYKIVFLISYLLIIFFVLRYGYYLAMNRVSWDIIKDDFLYLLNRKYFTQGQWLLNVLLFWLAFIGFVSSLAISIMKGNL